MASVASIPPPTRAVKVGQRRCGAIVRLARIANLAVHTRGKKTVVELTLRENTADQSPDASILCRLVCDTARFHELLFALMPDRNENTALLPGYAPTSSYVRVFGLYNVRGELIGISSLKRQHPVFFTSKDVIGT